MAAKSGTKSEVKRSISTKLLAVLIPLTAAAIIFIILFISMQARSIITSLASTNLEQESKANSLEIGGEIEAILGAYDEFGDTLGSVKFASDDAIQSYFETTLSISPMCDVGAYGGFDDGKYFDGSQWEPPADYVVEERDWYIDGQNNVTFTAGAPYLDAQSGSMIVSFSRKVTLTDGCSGVIAVDMSLDTIVEAVSGMKPLGTGTTMLLSGDDIIAYYDTSFNGSTVSEHAGDTFLSQVAALEKSGAYDTIHSVKAENGQTYYVALDSVNGTDWTLISSVSESDVLRQLNQFQMICYILMAAMIVVIGFIMLKLIQSRIKKPVEQLTENITRIADGDFTVEIDASGDDEIGVMNQHMKEFVTKMRGTLGDIQDETGRLSAEANNSREASSSLNVQANEQSQSMAQIQDTMEGMATAVSELANHATQLATAVSELTDKGSVADDTVKALVTQAEAGQRDMGSVQIGMQSISESMTDMNKVVVQVDESAKEISSIIEMINSIAEQTNLLALNASIEAARAGEAGRGFAVVATEIGKLATDSSEAASKIGDIIREITTQIQDLSAKSAENMTTINVSSEAVQTAGGTFERIFHDLDETSEIVENMIQMMSEVDDIASSVAAISEEQSASTEEVSATVDTLAVSAAQVADESKDVDESANTVSKSADVIGNFVNIFRI